MRVLYTKHMNLAVHDHSIPLLELSRETIKVSEFLSVVADGGLLGSRRVQ